ncbi:MAG: cytochrome c-type biogenesis protein CcmH [Defluviimonas sp.]|uniref:cytochrome c-type biogenesis protein n=1 Tax=Albidovulum sp. TaxID=1872424 RepID=UPI001DC9591C|nr:cytochrome c-type biogenesis protein CcmH [Paracoccaceae bacterium]MCC0064191.1 cytochrome c-type biogenesis protein CcmH [Defluviimonas sp.]
MRLPRILPPAFLIALAVSLGPAPAPLLSSALAVQPDEVLGDPVLEARARAISAKLRCPVCQGENIDESNAPVSRELRLVVRERLTAGDSDAQVIDYIVDRFGEFVLFEPRATGANLLLWVAGPAMLLLGLGGAAAYLRRRQRQPDGAPAPLSAAEEARIAELMKE